MSFGDWFARSDLRRERYFKGRALDLLDTLPEDAHRRFTKELELLKHYPGDVEQRAASLLLAQLDPPGKSLTELPTPGERPKPLPHNPEKTLRLIATLERIRAARAGCPTDKEIADSAARLAAIEKETAKASNDATENLVQAKERLARAEGKYAEVSDPSGAFQKELRGLPARIDSLLKQRDDAQRWVIDFAMDEKARALFTDIVRIERSWGSEGKELVRKGDGIVGDVLFEFFWGARSSSLHDDGTSAGYPPVWKPKKNDGDESWLALKKYADLASRDFRSFFVEPSDAKAGKEAVYGVTTLGEKALTKLSRVLHEAKLEGEGSRYRDRLAVKGIKLARLGELDALKETFDALRAKSNAAGKAYGEATRRLKTMQSEEQSAITELSASGEALRKAGEELSNSQKLLARCAELEKGLRACSKSVVDFDRALTTGTSGGEVPEWAKLDKEYAHAAATLKKHVEEIAGHAAGR